MYCTYCNKLVSEKLAVRREFCPYCGRRLHWFGIPDVELSKPIMQAILKRKNFLVKQRLDGIDQHYYREYKLDMDLVELQDALQINPDNLKARFRLALYYMELKRYDKSSEEFGGILSKDPKHADALSYMANIAAEEGRYLEAVGFCDRLLELEPDNLAALYNRAVGLYYHGDLMGALDGFRHIQQLDEDNEAVHQAIREIVAHLN